MEAALPLDLLDHCRIFRGYGASLAHFTTLSNSNNKGSRISVANRLFVDKMISYKPTYAKEVLITFRASALNVDFERTSARVTEEIDRFVKNKSFGLIPQVLSEPLDRSTILTLVNCLHFKGSWDKKFVKPPSGLSQNIDRLRSHCGLTPSKATGMNFKGLMPYASNENNPERTSMTIVMPDAIFASGITSGMKNHFAGLLADLSSKVKISKTAHQAKIQVDEQGTEASKASGVVVAPKGTAPVQSFINLVIDRPFLAFIMLYDRCSDDPLPLSSAVLNHV
ncbi:serpin-Z7-like [Galendromus occidentalis]|uniref:Serpin-Z7-like n=1 Tax=Galendromus occidentalis TaxID=34638 RepID=A0AAJ6QVP2_9ACAR|nr:serpin-Z7-like [Galendromus occidentalis]